MDACRATVRRGVLTTIFTRLRQVAVEIGSTDVQLAYPLAPSVFIPVIPSEVACLDQA